MARSVQFTGYGDLQISFINGTVRSESPEVPRPRRLHAFIRHFANDVISHLSSRLRVIVYIRLSGLQIPAECRRTGRQRQEDVVIFQHLLSRVNRRVHLRVISLSRQGIRQDHRAFNGEDSSRRQPRRAQPANRDGNARFKFVSANALSHFNGRQSGILLVYTKDRFKGGATMNFIGDLANGCVQRRRTITCCE